jgi:4a-hydroxytetrahydrobiopterin dehydratase
MTRLTETEIETHLARVPSWERRGQEIRRTFAFASFEEAMAFVNRVARLAEAAGGLTARDFALAASIGA